MSGPTTGERLIRAEVLMEETRKEVRDGFIRIERQLEKIDLRMNHAEEKIATASVGFKTLLWVAGIITTAAGTVGALVAKYLPFLAAAPR